MGTLIFGRMVVYKWNKLINEDPNFWSIGRVQNKERINERGSYNLVEWSCTNKRKKINEDPNFGRMVVRKRKINERGRYILVEWSCANKRNKSVGTLNFGRMAVHTASAKITELERSISPYSIYGKMLDCSIFNFQSMNSPMELNSLFSKFFCYITKFVTWPD